MKNAIEWFDIPSSDFQRALEFYSTILGEPLQVRDYQGQKLGFFPMDPKGDVGGDLVPPGPDNAPSGKGTRVYLNCDGRLDEVLARVKPAGGKIVRPKFSIPDADLAIIQDTEGNIVGLSSTKRQ